MILIPGEKNKIRQEIRKAEQRKRRRLTKEERRRIVKQEHKIMKRKVALAGVLAAIGITGAVGLTKQLPEASKQPVKTVEESNNQKDEFLSGIKVDNNELNKDEEKSKNNDIFKRIVEKYNEEYPEDKIQEEDLGIVETEPQFLTEQINSDNTVTYIQDYTQEHFEDNQNFIRDNDDAAIDKAYVVINKKDKTVILTEGKVNEEIVYIDSKIIRFKNDDYIGKNKIVLGETKEEKVKTYYALRQKFKEKINEQNGTSIERE